MVEKIISAEELEEFAREEGKKGNFVSATGYCGSFIIEIEGDENLQDSQSQTDAKENPSE